MNPRDQFLDVERLRQVVVSPEVESFQSLVQLAPGGEENHRNGIALLSEILQDAQPIPPGKHDVQDDGIIRFRRCQGVSLVAVVAEVDHHALLFQSLANEGSDLLLIFDNQDAHDP